MCGLILIASKTAGGVSLSAGQRSKVYTRLFSSSAFANGIGPIVATLVFLRTDNMWSEHALQACLGGATSCSSVLFVSSGDAYCKVCQHCEFRCVTSIKVNVDRLASHQDRRVVRDTCIG